MAAFIVPPVAIKSSICTARRWQIDHWVYPYDHDTLTGLDGIRMHLNGIGSILKVIGL